MSEIEVLSKKDAISVTKPNRTIVDYYLFDEFEVHKCVIPPHSIQEWHIHKIIEEVIVVVAGNITVNWKENGEVRRQIVSTDSILRVKNSIHNIENNTDYNSEFIVLRMVPTGCSKKELIKNDKIVIDNVTC